MKLLQKMGWQPGEGLGRNKEGTLEPLALDIKTDKKGLVSREEVAPKSNANTVKNVNGVEYRPCEASTTTKEAKAQSAAVCLQSLSNIS